MNAADVMTTIGNEHHAWDLFEGLSVNHSTFGSGVIERVEQRYNYSPLFHMRFGSESVLFSVESFKNRKTIIFLDSEHVKEIERIRKIRESREEAALESKRIQAESKRIQAAREKAQVLAIMSDRHRRRLESRGITYMGLRSATQSTRQRVAPCYECGSHLDNKIDMECNACGWILCLCGACGCGYYL